ncbi:MAG: phage late control D family protein [Clostridium sp.]
MPKKGDKLTPIISLYNWTSNGITKRIHAGRMVLDDLSFDGAPHTCTIGAVSMPAKGEFKDGKPTHTYKSASIEEIARKIAKRAGIALCYSAPHIVVKNVEQSKTSDSEFLLSLCNEYGLGIKIYNGKIVIFNEETYENKRPVANITLLNGNVASYSWNTTLQKTYTGAKVSYTDAKTNKKHQIKIGKAGRMLNVDVTAYSKRDAQLKAKALLAAENKKRVTMTVDIMPNPKIIATATVQLKKAGKLSGNIMWIK